MSDLGTTLRTERAAFRRTLIAVGPDEPTACGSWTTTDLAVHVASGELAGGGLSSGARLLVGRGVRVDRLGPANTAALSVLRLRRGFDWAIARLDRDPPAMHRSGAIGAVSLLEVWAHHEDVRAIHDVAPRDDDPDLTPLLALLVRYHRGSLTEQRIRVRADERTWFEPLTADVDADRPVVDIHGTVADLCRWLAGRDGAEALSIAGPPGARDAVLATHLTI